MTCQPLDAIGGIMAERDLTAADRERILRYLQGSNCVCGSKKGKMRPFCNKNYLALPRDLRGPLGRSCSNGFEKAFMAACEFLKVGKYAENEETSTS